MIYILGTHMNECALLNNVMKYERIETQVFCRLSNMFVVVGVPVIALRNLEMIIVCGFWGSGQLANLI